MAEFTVAYIPGSHLDLFWLGSYQTCLERGREVIMQYVDRCLANGEETFLLETVVFAEHFLAKHPEYLERFRQLVAEGRLEVGAAYIDRWETRPAPQSQPAANRRCPRFSAPPRDRRPWSRTPHLRARGPAFDRPDIRSPGRGLAGAGRPAGGCPR